MRLEAIRRLWLRLAAEGEPALGDGSLTESEEAIGRMILPLVSDLEQAKRAAGEAVSRARALEAALDLLPVAAIVLDEGGRFLTSNAQSKTLFGGPAIPASVLEAARLSAAGRDEKDPCAVMERPAGNAFLRIVPAAIGEGPSILFLVPTDGDAQVPTAPLIARYGLSRSEARVVALVAQGLTNREVAGRLKVSAETVHTHLKRTFEKTGVSSRLALVALAFGARFGIGPRGGKRGKG